ncbi:NAD-dependent epimerase/dehydratase-like protein [Dothidotthia symphoricarpi CBS 119687]|uniref:NAD-dependent epimerase/dehydratase-like protein n=1 Tax=Dothidotthia symphoricarpi CBS 119687 TaxID=1392245 RepID=A0A6A5ZZU3_9PLEO|nr:NAD-dependent epimerase/dehydratase-like protein [Dothidotthia symphoricarpi CBS 119687]KAF2124237.1 NAD-dependent epimerase/dehydratase-like protein [Dothidotthia symphoricarpi CBS 119687]
MRVLVIGGSGRTGKLVINELQQRGHEVTALVRNPASMPSDSKVHLITGTPTNKDDVRTAFTASRPHVVIVTLSAVRASDSPFAANISPPRMMADSNANVVAAMKESSTPKAKLVILQAFGVAESWPNLHCVMRLLMKNSNMIYQYQDHDAVAKEVRDSGVRYVMARPSRLVEGEATEVNEWAGDGKGVPMMGVITRESVARFLVDAAEKETWDGTAPVITN